MRVGSLFAGIGGFDLAAEWCGHSTAWMSEVDPYCVALLRERFPEARQLGDITTIDWATVEPVDIVCGGFPCQDISYAGKGAGLEGERSGLWWEFARCVRELGPRYVVVENVRALFTRGFDAVLGTLADLGYDAEWAMYGASDVGAPHRRHRVWILAYANAERELQQEGAVRHERRWAGDGGSSGDVADASGLAERESADQADALPACGQTRDEPGNGGEDVADAGRGRRGGAGARQVQQPWGAETVRRGEALAHPQRERSQGLEQAGAAAGATDGPGDGRYPCGWATEPDVGRVAHGVPARVDRLRGLGNAIVPACAVPIFERIAQLETGRLMDCAAWAEEAA